MWQLHLLPEKKIINNYVFNPFVTGPCMWLQGFNERLINRPYCICHKATTLLALEWKQSLGGYNPKSLFLASSTCRQVNFSLTNRFWVQLQTCAYISSISLGLSLRISFAVFCSPLLFQIMRIWTSLLMMGFAGRSPVKCLLTFVTHVVCHFCQFFFFCFLFSPKSCFHVRLQGLWQMPERGTKHFIFDYFG